MVPRSAEIHHHHDGHLETARRQGCVTPGQGRRAPWNTCAPGRSLSPGSFSPSWPCSRSSRCGRCCGPAPAAQRRWATARGRSPSSRPRAPPPSRASAWRWGCPTTRSRSRWPRRCRSRGCATCPGGDRDSAGLFQQRPSQGWGTVAQVTDPVYAATAFYAKLRTEPDWPTLSVTEAAQLVQRSATPEAYARWEPMARSLARALTGEDAAAMTCHELTLSVPGEDVATVAAAELGTRGSPARSRPRGAGPSPPGSWRTPPGSAWRPSPTTGARGRRTRARGATPGRRTACCRCAAPRAQRPERPTTSEHRAELLRTDANADRSWRATVRSAPSPSRGDPIMVTG